MVMLLLNETCMGLLNLPFLVVITITPLPALTPHIDAAAASLSTVMLSTSFGLIVLMSPSYGKLSTTMRGCVLENKVLWPLILISSGRLGTPLKNTRLLVMPSSLLMTSGATRLLNSFIFTVTKEPVALSLGIF